MATHPLNLYLNFTQRYDALLQQLREIRQSYQTTKTLPALAEGVELLDFFIHIVFQENTPQQYYLANPTSESVSELISIRPAGKPATACLFPPGITPIIHGALSAAPDNAPELLVEQISTVPAIPQTISEHLVTAIPKQTNGKRPNNLFTSRLLEELCRCVQKKAEYLNQFRDFLDWKEADLRLKYSGVRYFQTALTENSCQIYGAAKSQDIFQALEANFQDARFSALPLSCSDRPDKFSYRYPEQLLPAIPIGTLSGIQYIDAPAEFSQNISAQQQTLVFARLDFKRPDTREALPESARAETAENQPDFSSGRLPAQGFLFPTLFIEEYRILHHQYTVLQDLSRTADLSAFLPSWFCDIADAQQPCGNTSPVINWRIPQLNTAQKKAVNTILNGASPVLLQSPPGTGKHLVTSEAIYQLICRKKNVLLITQTETALETLLNSFAGVPEARAISLNPCDTLPSKPPFSQEQKLKNFYATLAANCQEHYFNDWEAYDKQIQQLENQSEQLRLLKASLEAFNQELFRSAAQLETRKDIYINLFNLLLFLEKRSDVTLNIPETLLKSIWSTFLEVINQLKRYKIDLNPYWQSWEEPFTSAEKSEFFKKIFKRWDAICTYIPKLDAEIKCLKESHPAPPSAPQPSLLNPRSSASSLLTPEKRLTLFQLTQKLETAEIALEKGDDTRLEEWRQLKQQIGLLRQHPDQYNIFLYATFFNMEVNGTPFYKKLLNPSLDSKAILTVLAHARRALNNTREYLQSLETILKESLRNLLIRLLSVHPELATLFPPGTTQEEALLNHLIRQRRKKNMSDIQWQREFPASPESLEQFSQQISDTHRELEQGQTFKHHWEAFLKNWMQRLSAQQQHCSNQSHFLPTYLPSCNIVGATCDTYLQLGEAFCSTFDTVIISEINHMTLPELLPIICRTPQSIWIGDDQRITPLQTSAIDRKCPRDFPCPQDNDAESAPKDALQAPEMLNPLFFNDYLSRAAEPIRATLSLQYRMHPEIMEIINHFYNFQLTHGLPEPEAVYQHHLSLNIPDEAIEFITPETHVIWIDTTQDPFNRPFPGAQQTGAPFYNSLEAILIAEILQKMDTCYIISDLYQDPPQDVGVITFYQEQVAEISRYLEPVHFQTIQPEVSTIEQFQNQQKSIILVSLVNYLTEEGEALPPIKAPRISSAFSRAADLLIILGARDVFSNWVVEFSGLPGNESIPKNVYAEMMSLLNRNSRLWDSFCIILPEKYQALIRRGT